MKNLLYYSFFLFLVVEGCSSQKSISQLSEEFSGQARLTLDDLATFPHIPSELEDTVVYNVPDGQIINLYNPDSIRVYYFTNLDAPGVLFRTPDGFISVLYRDDVIHSIDLNSYKHDIKIYMMQNTMNVWVGLEEFVVYRKHSPNLFMDIYTYIQGIMPPKDLLKLSHDRE